MSHDTNLCRLVDCWSKTIEYPKFYRSNVTFKKAKKAKPSEKGHSRQMRLEDAE